MSSVVAQKGLRAVITSTSTAVSNEKKYVLACHLCHPVNCKWYIHTAVEECIKNRR